MWLDQIIEYFSPQAGKQRLKARLQLQLARSYDGAATGRRRENWLTRGSSANSEILRDGAKLRDRSRDLVRNNPYARKGQRAYVQNTVGTGILPRPNTGSDHTDRKLRELFEEWSATCYGPARLNFFGVQALVARTVFQSGECLVRMRRAVPSETRRIPLMLQVLEPDHLDVAKISVTKDGNRVIGGIEYDALERPVAYWLWPEHPGEALVLGPRKSFQSIRVPAEDVLHIYRVDRPGQSRGVGDLAASMTKLRDMDDYDDAEIVRKQIASCLAAFIETPEGGATDLSGEQSTETDTGATIEKLRAGMILRGRPGEKAQAIQPPSDSSSGQSEKRWLHAIAAGIGVTYEQLTGDLSGVNYSSYRAGLIDFRGLVEEDRWNMYVPMLCQPVWDEVMKTAFLASLTKKAFYKVQWVPPAFQSVDPLKDANATEKEIRLGTMTLPQAIAEKGYNPDEQLKEIAETNTKLDKLGIISSGDARKVTPSGNPVLEQDNNTKESKNATE